MRKITAANRPLIFSRPYLSAAFLTLGFLWAMTLAPGHAAGENGIRDIPETIHLNLQESCPDIPGLTKDLKGVRDFPHKAHAMQFLNNAESYATKPFSAAFSCAACHTGATTSNDILGKPGCERLAEELSTAGETGDVKKHFHAICLSCHKNMKKDGKKTGPVSCKGCHGR